jgi:predicted RNA-binding Zn-ribbon protein involved in translation (DUF1610 family)
MVLALQRLEEACDSAALALGHFNTAVRLVMAKCPQCGEEGIAKDDALEFFICLNGCPEFPNQLRPTEPG